MSDIDDLYNAFRRALTPQPWTEQAECRGLGPSLFFLDRYERSTDAKAVCEVCSVARECGEYGRYETHGIWGGLTLRQRQRTPGTEAAADPPVPPQSKPEPAPDRTRRRTAEHAQRRAERWLDTTSDWDMTATGAGLILAMLDTSA
jgi:WhiB family transcriptional regulator, redox-sensing transcriptional regulator